MKEIKFGFWQHKFHLGFDDVKIDPVSDHDDIIRGIKESGRVAGKWFYPPFTRAYDSKIAEEKRPLVYEGSFGIKATHTLLIPDHPEAEKRGEFLIALLGMLEGLRLIPEAWNHFYRVAIEPHSLTDLVCDQKEEEKVLASSQQFWRTKDESVRRLIFGAIHWLLFSGSYLHEFERFSGQYIVLDTCFRLHCHLEKIDRRTIRHGNRPEFLAKQYGMPIPSWATIQNNTCALSRLRNEFFHEGHYGGEPIGFAHPKFNPSIDLQLNAFNTRLILAMLKIDCSYIKSPVDSRSMHGIGLKHI